MDEGLTIAEAARHTGLTAHTLRYYEREGLMLEAPPRGGNGHRRYTDADLGWIRLLSRLRATGMPVRDMRRYAQLRRSGAATATERKELLHAHRERVLARIAQLEGDLVLVDEKIAKYEKIEKDGFG